MASGTQSYQNTSGSLIDPAKRAWDKRDDTFKKLKKFSRQLNTIYEMYQHDALGGVAPTDRLLTPANDRLLEPGKSALPPADDLIDPSSPSSGVIAVLTRIADDIQTQNQILGVQTKMLAASMDLTRKFAADQKRIRRESRLEEGVDLSGTQGVVNIGRKMMGGGSGGGLLDNIADIADIVQLGNMLRKSKWLRKLNLGSKLKGFKGFNFRNPFRNWGKANKATSNISRTSNFLPSSSNVSSIGDGITSSLGVGGGRNIDAIEATVNAIPKSSTVNQVVNNATNLNKVANNTSNVSKVLDQTSNLSKVSDLNKITNVTEATGGLKFLKNSPLKYLLPGASFVSGGSNLMEGNFAEAGLDFVDAGVDTAVATGVISQTGPIASTMGPAIAVTGAGLLSGWLGELTRGTDDWIRGDGTNAAKNALGDLTAGLSGALETVGAPFTALFSGVDSLIKTGGFSESNKKMAEVDTNIREGFRKFLNVWDPLNVISDEVGSFGTLRWYGKENTENAKEQLLKDKGIIQDTNGENTVTNEGDSTTINNSSTTNRGNVTSTANRIEESTDIQKDIINTVIQGGTSGNAEVDQKIFNHYRLLQLEDDLLTEDDEKVQQLIMAEIAGIQSGEIKAENPFITNNESTINNGGDVNNGGDTTTNNNDLSSSINKPNNSVNNMLAQAVTKSGAETTKIVISPPPVVKDQNTSNEQSNVNQEYSHGLTDTNADLFKQLTYFGSIA